MVFLPFIFIPILAFGDAAYLTVRGSQSNNEVDTSQFVPTSPATKLSWRS
jgi:hypothetical protein